MNTVPRETPVGVPAAIPAQPPAWWSAPRQPLTNLAFLLPILIFYEWQARAVGVAGGVTDSAAARRLLGGLVAWWGPAFGWVPAVLLPATLLAWQLAARRPWRIAWWAPPLMVVESALLAAPLAVLSRVLGGAPLRVGATLGLPPEWVGALGAALYEEFIFRLVLIALVGWLLVRGLSLPRTQALPLAWVVAATIFAAAHLQPLGAEAFSAAAFAVRLIGGVYLGAVLHYRGLGVATGAHAIANVVLVGFVTD